MTFTSLRVNGVDRQVAALPAKRLAYVLREDLGLTGTKIGCDAGDCGACTVLLDDAQVCACITPLGACAGRAVITVEGLSAEGVPNALQRAFVEQGAAQCGICTPGMLMAATALLKEIPQPTEAQIEAALSGVLCRCTGYRKIIEAVLKIGLTVDAGDGGVGTRLPRLDGPAKVTGAEKFGADLVPPDCLDLRIIRSPHPRARFVIGDLAAFRADYPQVLDMITAADVPENRFAVFPTPKDQPVLADGHVRFRGEAVLGLIGERDALAEIPLSAIPVDWQVEVPLETTEAALTATGDLLHDFAPDNVLCRGRVVKGEATAALAQAAFTATGEFTTGHVEHAYIEPEAGYAEVLLQDGVERVRLFVSTQTPVMDKEEVARVLKLSHSQVHIIPSAIGGGFGGKLDIAVQPLVAVAAWKIRHTLKRAVRLVYTRPESMISTTKRHPARIRASLGCDSAGKLIAVDFAADFNTGAYASWGSTVANRVPVHASGPYAVPHVRALTRAVYTNNAIAGAFRGFGVPQACIATEQLIDDLATQAGIDPLEFRYRNAIRAGDQTATGQTLYASAGLDQCLDALRPAWNNALQACAVKNGSGIGPSDTHTKRYGAGIACMWYGIGNTVIANPSTMTIGLKPNGRFMLYNGAQEIGQGTYTIMPQIAATALAVPVALIDQLHSDTDLTEDAGKSSASRQTFVSGNAARLAGEDLRRQLLRLAGFDEDAPAQLSFSQGRLRVALNNQAKEIDLLSLDQNEQGDVALGRGYFSPATVPLDANGQGVPYATYGFAAQIAEVEVDLKLGTVKVLHVHAAHDVGRAINPTLVEGQIHGGIAQGLGLALMEEYVSGKTDNLHDYLIPTIGDIPPITTHLIEDPEPVAPYGAKGVGEPALIPTAPAIFNAIRHALGWGRGRHVATTPATPDRLYRAICMVSDTPPVA